MENTAESRQFHSKFNHLVKNIENLYTRDTVRFWIKLHHIKIRKGIADLFNTIRTQYEKTKTKGNFDKIQTIWRQNIWYGRESSYLLRDRIHRKVLKAFYELLISGFSFSLCNARWLWTNPFVFEGDDSDTGDER